MSARRLIGWRVRWEEWGDGWNGWAARASAWFFVHPTLQRHARSEARTFARGLSRDDTRLAVTETVTASPRLTRQRDHGIAWKLAFTAWREQVGGVAYKTFKPVPAPWLRGSFADFLANMAVREGLPAPDQRHLDAIEAAGWQRLREVLRLSIPRHAFRRALELWLVLDLADYLGERGYEPSLSTFCDRQLTPRNLLLTARRM